MKRSLYYWRYWVPQTVCHRAHLTFGVLHFIGRMKVMVPNQSTSSEAKLHDIIMPGYTCHSLSPTSWALAPFIKRAAATAAAAAAQRKKVPRPKNVVMMNGQGTGPLLMLLLCCCFVGVERRNHSSCVDASASGFCLCEEVSMSG